MNLSSTFEFICLFYVIYSDVVVSVLLVSVIFPVCRVRDRFSS